MMKLELSAAALFTVSVFGIDDSQRKVRCEVQQKEADLEPTHASVVDLVELFDWKFEPAPMKAEYTIVREDERREPHKQQPHIDDCAPTKDASKNFERHEVSCFATIYDDKFSNAREVRNNALDLMVFAVSAQKCAAISTAF
jgi:hypothetical protein